MYFSFSSNFFIFWEISCSFFWRSCPDVLFFFNCLFACINSFICLSFSLFLADNKSFSLFILLNSDLFKLFIFFICSSFSFNFFFKSSICLFKLFLTLIIFFWPDNSFSYWFISFNNFSFLLFKSEIFPSISPFSFSKVFCLLFKLFILFSFSFKSLFNFSISCSLFLIDKNKLCLFSNSLFFVLNFFNSFSVWIFFCLSKFCSLFNFSISFLLFKLLISISFSFSFNFDFKLFISLL